MRRAPALPDASPHRQREREPQSGEHHAHHRCYRGREEAAHRDVEDEEHAPDEGQDEGGESDAEESVPELNGFGLDAPAEGDAVHGDRSNEQSCGQCRRQQGRDVGPALEIVDRGEPLGERQREEESEEYLHTGLGDPQLLQHLHQVAISSL